MKNFSTKMLPLAVLALFLAAGFNSVLTAGTEEPGTDKQVLSFEENTGNRMIKIDTAGPRLPIVDVNSQLIIHVDRAQVLKKAGKSFASDIPTEMEEGIAEIEKILNMQSEILMLQSVKAGDDESTRKQKLNKFSEAMFKLLAFAQKSPLIKQRVIEVMETIDDITKIYPVIFEIIGEEIGKLPDRVRESPDHDIYFRLGGWILHKGKERHIHIEGFDTYKELEYSLYPFFTRPTPEEFSRRIRKIQEQAARVNAEGFSSITSLKDNLKETVDRLKDELDPTLDCAIDSVKDTLDLDIEDIEEDLKETEEFLENLEDMKEKVDELVDMAEKLNESRADLEAQYNLLFGIERLSVGFKGEVENLLKDFKNAEQEIKEVIKIPDLKVEVKETLTETLKKIDKECLEGLKDVIDSHLFVKDFWDMIKSLFSASKESSTVLSNFGEEVESMLIDNIPDQGVVNLRRAGPIEEGDEIVFKAVLEKLPKKEEEPVKSATIARHSMVMFKIIKMELNPGLIFVDPLGQEDQVAFSKTFQAAPSYSVLFKPGNRRSYTYNRFLRIGFGINVTALDFNQDSNYELGLGFVLSTFNDYLQVGIGRNMDSDGWYWFFGLNLPFGDIALPTAVTGGGTSE
jgi:hypothetical protein